MAVLIVLVRRNRCAIGAVVRRVVDDEVPGLFCFSRYRNLVFTKSIMKIVCGSVHFMYVTVVFFSPAPVSDIAPTPNS